MYTRPFLIPEGNPYDDYSGDEYFRGKDTEAKVAAGAELALKTEQLVGRKGQILELGCGRGELLEGARQVGWETAGIEMTPGFAAELPGQQTEVSTIAASTLLDDTYDAIWLAAILEHLYDPADVVSRVHAALAPGGVAFFDVPNECGLWTRVGNAYMRLLGRDWAINLSPTFPPFHVVGFCPRSLRYLLERAGFEIVALRTHRWINELPARPGLLPRLERWGAEIVLDCAARMRMGAGITCWARKQA